LGRWILVILFIVIAVGYLNREPLRDLVFDGITRDMFVAADDDEYDPGLPVGSVFPAINTRFNGNIIDSVEPFILDKGMIFIAVRSIDW